MRIRTSKTKNGRLFYVIKTYYDSHGVEHTVTVEKLGNENDIRRRTGRDPDEWAKEYVAELNEKERLEKQDVTLTISKTKRITKNHQYSFQVGYLFLQSLYHHLGFPKICKEIQKRHAFEYDLDAILSRLIYGRILLPCSKLTTLKFSKTLLEKPNFTEKQIYRALDVLAEEAQYDGFYAVCTNLDDNPLEIIKVNRQRREIEESFRIMKTEFKSRPAYVYTKEHIEAHYLVCFLALVVYRYLERMLKKQFTCEAIIHTLREMKVLEVMGQGYIPEYTRTELTDALHETFDFHTDYQFISSEEMKKVIKKTKRKTKYAKK